MAKLCQIWSHWRSSEISVKLASFEKTGSRYFHRQFFVALLSAVVKIFREDFFARNWSCHLWNVFSSLRIWKGILAPQIQTKLQYYEWRCYNITVVFLLNPIGNCFLIFFLKWASPASYSFIFGLVQTNINTILQQINVKNIHPVYATGIRTHDLKIVSLLPLPLDQGSRPSFE